MDVGIDKLELDDLVCLYKLVDRELNDLDMCIMPNTLKDYFNQLTRLLAVIRQEVLKKDDK